MLIGFLLASSQTHSYTRSACIHYIAIGLFSDWESYRILNSLSTPVIRLNAKHWFLPRVAVQSALACMMPMRCVCLSVCPFVFHTHEYTGSKRLKLKQNGFCCLVYRRHYSFWYQISGWNSGSSESESECKRLTCNQKLTGSQFSLLHEPN